MVRFVLSTDHTILQLVARQQLTFHFGHAVYFKDIILPASDDDDEDESDLQSDTTGPEQSSTDEPQPDLGRPQKIEKQKSKRIHRVDRQKLIIILVGLPGRGKTFLCNKLMCYLNWYAQTQSCFQLMVHPHSIVNAMMCRLGHTTRHFNVGQYRRKQKGDDLQDATFFDHNNAVRKPFGASDAIKQVHVKATHCMCIVLQLLCQIVQLCQCQP